MTATTRSIGVVPVETVRTMSGLEFLQGWRDGRFPSPPISGFLGGDLVEVAEGRVVFAGAPGPQHYNPLGSVHGGYAATLLDSCMGCAVHSTLPAGQGYTTLEIKVNMVRGLSADTGKVQAIGTVLSTGRRVGVAEGRLVDSSGRLLAHGSTTCLIFPI
jgi:uncharacterized protein (TIGR00369 family)